MGAADRLWVAGDLAAVVAVTPVVAGLVDLAVEVLVAGELEEVGRGRE